MARIKAAWRPARGSRMNGFSGFGEALAAALRDAEPGLLPCPGERASLRSAGGARLDLTPVACVMSPASAGPYFAGVRTAADLMRAYRRARAALPFEEDDTRVSGYVDGFAHVFLESLLASGSASLGPDQARAIGAFAGGLDIYSAVRSVESLLNSPADRALLEVAPSRQWQVHFDHLAIRCGSEGRGDAARVAGLLTGSHGYSVPQLASQAEYRFDDGWNARPVYKMLDNGTLVRLFIDESSRGEERQVIQHWNRLYGFTAHHLALRATRTRGDGAVEAVPLCDLVAALQARGVECLAPTGEYSLGLLEQVFTRPKSTPNMPAAALARLDPALRASVRLGKLTELVSRREMPHALGREYFRLYGLTSVGRGQVRSAPAYNYFLPAQAAHVIRTSESAPTGPGASRS